MRISDWSSDVCSSDLEITAKNATPLTFTGGKTPVTAQYAKDYVAFSYRVTPKTAVKDSDVVFVGYGINAPEKGWNDYAGLHVKGQRSAERCVGKEWVGTCRSRWSPADSKKKEQHQNQHNLKQ